MAHQVAPTIVQALGLDPNALDAVQAEGTPVLPEVGTSSKSRRVRRMADYCDILKRDLRSDRRTRLNSLGSPKFDTAIEYFRLELCIEL